MSKNIKFTQNHLWADFFPQPFRKDTLRGQHGPLRLNYSIISNKKNRNTNNKTTITKTNNIVLGAISDLPKLISKLLFLVITSCKLNFITFCK